MTMMERLIRLTVPPNLSFFSSTMKLLVPVLIGICMIIPGISALPDVGISVTPADDSILVVNIKSPQENQIFLNDVVPPHIWVSGDVKSPVALQSIKITSGEGSTDCGNESPFGCNVPATTGQNRIIITFMDSAGNQVSIPREFTIKSGGLTLPARITISGRITDPEGRPVEGVVIRLISGTQPVTAESNTDGSYRINNAYGYHQKIRVEKKGYANITKEMDFNENLNTVDFTLEQTTKPVSGFTAILTTLVIHSPSEGETIWLDVVPPHAAVIGEVKASCPVKSVYAKTTDGGVTACGNTTSFACEVPVLPGNNRIIVTATDAQGNTAMEVRNFTVEISLLPPTAGNIYGTVTDSDGRPLSNATVTAESSLTLDNTPLSVSAISDDHGIYRLVNVQGRQQIVYVRKEGYISVDRAIVLEDRTTEENFTLKSRISPVPGFEFPIGTMAVIAAIGISSIAGTKRRRE